MVRKKLGIIDGYLGIFWGISSGEVEVSTSSFPHRSFRVNKSVNFSSALSSGISGVSFRNEPIYSPYRLSPVSTPLIKEVWR
jgi:hypothetical protein